jgi:hypothetical protein
MIMNGLISMGAATARVGCSLAKRIASSVLTWPSMMLLSVYICSETSLKPVAGPPERISSRTPVSLPSATSGALTMSFLVSTFGLGPSMW